MKAMIALPFRSVLPTLDERWWQRNLPKSLLQALAAYSAFLFCLSNLLLYLFSRFRCLRLSCSSLLVASPRKTIFILKLWRFRWKTDDLMENATKTTSPGTCLVPRRVLADSRATRILVPRYASFTLPSVLCVHMVHCAILLDGSCSRSALVDIRRKALGHLMKFTQGRLTLISKGSA